MLNFLPEKEAKIARSSYRRRLFACVAVALAAGVAAVGLASVPVAVTAWQATDDIKSKVAALKESTENQQFSETLEAARKLRANVSALSPVLAPSESDALEIVITKSRPSIAISSIDLKRRATSTVIVTITGVAETRDSLLSFVSDLDQDPMIEASLPVSDLAREKSAPFSVEAAVIHLAEEADI